MWLYQISFNQWNKRACFFVVKCVVFKNVHLASEKKSGLNYSCRKFVSPEKTMCDCRSNHLKSALEMDNFHFKVMNHFARFLNNAKKIKRIEKIENEWRGFIMYKPCVEQISFNNGGIKNSCANSNNRQNKLNDNANDQK